MYLSQVWNNWNIFIILIPCVLQANMDNIVPRLSQLLNRDPYLHPYAQEIERR